MHKKNIKLFVIVGAILLCCFFSTVAYSALYSTMDITGVAYARVVKDVRITDFRLNSSSNATSQYEEFGVNTISTKFNLLDSSSSVVFDVEVTNYGSADVGILQLSGNVPTGLSYEIINYNLEDKLCDDTGKSNQMAVKTFQIKFTGTPGEYELIQELDFRTYHAVTYTDITNNGYPTEVIDGGDLSVTFNESLKRIAVLSDGIEIDYYSSISSGQMVTISNVLGELEFKEKELVARLVSKELDEVGSEVCIKDECFYVISNDGSTVSMFSKYYLYVGGTYENSILTAYGDEATGIQDSSMGLHDSVFYGVTAFSENSSEYSGSIVERYVNNYHNYLKTLGVTPKKSRLITYDEVIKLGCVPGSSQACANAVSFLNETNGGFWTETAYDKNNVYFVSAPSFFMSISYSSGFINGVRPVIEISVDEIIETFEFTIADVTYKADEGMTWEDWIDSEYNTGGFKLFKYENSLGEYCFVFDANNDSLYLEDNDSDPIDPSDLIQSNGNYYINVERDEDVIPIS